MPRRSLRGRAKKRIQVRIPGNRSTPRYKKNKVKRPHCPKCGQPLTGIPSMQPAELRKLYPTQRKIERTYGGQLCHKCLSTMIKQAARTQTTQSP